MRLRIRHPEGMATLSDINSDETVSQLKDSIKRTIGLTDAQDIQISGGFPPKPYNDISLSLATAGIKDGDALTIKVSSTPAALSATPSTQAAAPAPSPAPAITQEGVVQTENGFLKLRIDWYTSIICTEESVLITNYISAAYVMNRDISLALELRQVIVNGIKNDPVMYSDVTLGQPREKYMEWIQKSTSWGGAIEIAILSAHFGVEIDSIDVQTGRIDRFGEGAFGERVLIVYSGIHYDALALAPTVDSPVDFDQTRFPVNDDGILTAAKNLVDGLRKSHKYTDLANFTVKCEQCGIGLKGEKDAQEHAGRTGHTRFSEYQ